MEMIVSVCLEQKNTSINLMIISTITMFVPIIMITPRVELVFIIYGPKMKSFVPLFF